MEQLGEFYRKNIISRETLIHEKWNKIKKELKLLNSIEHVIQKKQLKRR